MGEVNERGQTLLKLLIEHYIRDGQPVGSKTLAENKRVALSAASVRNVLADLEKQGYLVSPHTSAGRIPTPQGYRLFVDKLLQAQPLNQQAIEAMQAQLSTGRGLSQPVQSASSLLSALTEQVSLVTLPKQQHASLSRVEFLPMSSNRVLVVLIFSDEEIQNRIIYTDKVYSPAELQQASNCLSERFSGQPLEQIRTALLQEVQQQRAEMARAMALLIEATEQTEAATEANDYVLEGQNRLFDNKADMTIDDLRSLFEVFAEKQTVLHLLDKSIAADGVQIFIGSESGYQAFQPCSLVAAPYKVDESVVGVLGIIGPTRMDYQRVISVVDVTAKLLGRVLSERTE